MIKDDIAWMGEARHRVKVQDYLRIRQLQEKGKAVPEIAQALGLKSRRVYRLGKLHISKYSPQNKEKPWTVQGRWQR